MEYLCYYISSVICTTWQPTRYACFVWWYCIIYWINMKLNVLESHQWHGRCLLTLLCALQCVIVQFTKNVIKKYWELVQAVPETAEKQRYVTLYDHRTQWKQIIHIQTLEKSLSSYLSVCSHHEFHEKCAKYHYEPLISIEDIVKYMTTLSVSQHKKHATTYCYEPHCWYQLSTG